MLKKGTKKACRDFKGKTSSKDFFLIKTVFCLLSTVITKGSLANLSRFAGEHMQKIKEVFFSKKYTLFSFMAEKAKHTSSPLLHRIM